MQTTDLRNSDFIEPQLQNGPEGELDALDFLVLLAKHKRTIGKITAGAVVLTTIIVLLIPNRYTAEATLMPPQQTQSTSAMLMSQLASGGLGSLAALAGSGMGAALKNPSDLYVGVLKSRTIEDAIISKFDYQSIYHANHLSDARKKLKNATDIKVEKDGLITIDFEDSDPKRAADVANAYVGELKKVTQSLAVTEASQRRLFFEQQLQQAKDELANAEIAMKDTEQKTGMIHLDSQAKAIIDAIGHLQAQIAAKQVELRAMRSFVTEENPKYQLAQQQLAGLQAELAKLESQQPGPEGDPIVATGKLPAYGLEYMRRYRDVKYREAVFEILAKQFEAAKLDEAKQGAVIQQLDMAVPPDRKSWPPRTIVVLASILVGFILASAWVFGTEFATKLKEERGDQISMLQNYLSRSGKLPK